MAFGGLPASSQQRVAKVELSQNAGLATQDVDDVRAFQHGIDFLQLPTGRWAVIWASSGGVPRGEDDSGEWVHDMFYSWVDPAWPKVKPRLLIRAPAAQEPASAEAMPNGQIMVTMEDAWNAENNLAQSFAIFDRNLHPVLPYQNMIFEGGHSGHVAATNNGFVVFYSEGWVEGGGVENLGGLPAFVREAQPVIRAMRGGWFTRLRPMACRFLRCQTAASVISKIYRLVIHGAGPEPAGYSPLTPACSLARSRPQGW